ncbi:MAG: YqeG family HAD IIIA-type phosphatase [Clostridia bacterium]|nr:YqeG family HAD IIIA-type phosphatase [Clostridia bacterium]
MGIIKKYLHPRLYLSSVQQLDLEKLKQRGIKALLFDLDNTLLPRHQKQFSASTLQWLRELEAKGLKWMVVSNNNHFERLESLLQPLGIPYIYKAKKPGKKSFLRAAASLKLKPDEVAVVGDQVITDMLGANRAGIYSILVQPLPGKEYWGTTLINRRLERLIIKNLKPVR